MAFTEHGYSFWGSESLISKEITKQLPKQCVRQPIGKTFDRATVIFAISRFSSRFVTFLSFCSKIGILSTPNLVQSSYGRNRFGGVIWRRDDAATAMGKLTNYKDYWYDGLYQVQQHERGQLNAYLTGITSPVQSENFTFDEMGNWLAYDTQTPSLTLNQNRSYKKPDGMWHKIGPGELDISGPDASPKWGQFSRRPASAVEATACEMVLAAERVKRVGLARKNILFRLRRAKPTRL